MLNRLTAVGALGSLMMAASSWWVGAVPLSFRSHPPAVIDRFGIGSGVPRGVYYAGLVLLTVCWALLGRHLLRATKPIEHRPLIRLILTWALPMLAAMPLASRDVWAYAAQGHLDDHGLDPYRISPAQLPGIFADNVSARWIHSTSPYGPFWLLIGRGVDFLCGGHIQVAIFVSRLPALIGLLMMIWALPRLARRLQRRGDLALWLVAASPLTLVIGLGGSHNDLLMAGLAALGALAAVSSGSPLTTLALAAGVTAAGAAVKSPAFIAVAFVVPFWLRYSTNRRADQSVRGVVLSTAVTACLALTSFGTFTLLAGRGIGWATQTSTGAQANWLSLPTSGAMLIRLVSGHPHGATTVDTAMRDWRIAGLALAGIGLLALWLLALRCALGASTRRLDPLTALAISLIVIVVLGPAVQPWYFSWALPFAGLAVSPRRGRSMPAGASARAVGGMVGVVVALTYLVRPDGRGLQMQPIVLLVLAAGAVASALTVRGTQQPPKAAATESVPGDDDADGARTGVGAHRRRDL